MRIRERAIEVLDQLSPVQMLKAYEWLEQIKLGTTTENQLDKITYSKSRKALQGCTGNLSDDISKDRSDRL